MDKLWLYGQVSSADLLEKFKSVYFVNLCGKLCLSLRTLSPIKGRLSAVLLEIFVH